MKVRIKTLFFFFISFLIQIHAVLYAGVSVSKNSTESHLVDQRFLDQKKINEYQKNKRYQYDRKVKLGDGWWSSFLNWLFSKFIKFFSIKGSDTVLKWILYIFTGVVLTYFILMLFRVDMRHIFTRKPSSSMHVEYMEEDIHDMNFDKLIQSAIEQRDYRKAIRFFYLHALKKLADQGMIEWKPGKTNYDYLIEVKSEGIQSVFYELNQIFQYAWYGDFLIDEVSFKSAEHHFQQFNQALKKSEKK